MKKIDREMKWSVPLGSFDEEGRIAVPKEILAALKIVPGKKVTIRAKHGCIILRPGGDASAVRSLQGKLGHLPLVEALEKERRKEGAAAQ